MNANDETVLWEPVIRFKRGGVLRLENPLPFAEAQAVADEEATHMEAQGWAVSSVSAVRVTDQ